MKSDLSIDHEKNEISLEDNKSDRAAIALKAALGIVPAVGSILQEVVGVVIPNQKSERIKIFVEVLGQKIEHLEKEVIDAKMKTEEFTDLLEDALRQASRSLTDERREYIATFLKNSLNSDELDHIAEKKLLFLLSELNDVEIILLKYEAIHPEKRENFFDTHKTVLMPVHTHFGSSDSELQKEHLHKSYKSKLEDLGLIEGKFNRLKKGEFPEMDEKTGAMKRTGVRITGLGVLLLKYIDEKYDEDCFG